MNMFSGSTYSNAPAASHAFTMENMIAAIDRLKNFRPTPMPLRIFESTHLTEVKQTKFPRKKHSRRWQKKYRKKYTMTVPSMNAYWIKSEGILICHPAAKRKLIEDFERQGVLLK